ncbi:MAG: rRNA maturation RNase YbeY [Planctomycetota bacterium]
MAFARLGTAVRLRRKPLAEVVRAILAERGGPRGTLSLCAVSDVEMRRLSSTYKGSADTTDVLAFDLADGLAGPPVSGEVIVNAELAQTAGRRYGNTPDRELALYVIHGTLHLSGLDDGTAAARRGMRAAEATYLALYDRLCAPRPRHRRREGGKPSKH